MNYCGDIDKHCPPFTNLLYRSISQRFCLILFLKQQHLSNFVQRETKVYVVEKPASLHKTDFILCFSIFFYVHVAGFLPPLNDLPRCLPDQDIPAVQGYWLNGKWHSMLCRIPDFPKDMLHKCLRDKKVILHGDSTIGQWYKDFNSVLKADKPKALSSNGRGRGHLKPVQKIYRSLNLTVAYTISIRNELGATSMVART